MANQNRGQQEGNNRKGQESTSAGGDSQQQGGQGFAGMEPERQREIASQGGRAAHRSGNANEFATAQAREAGSKGGQSRGGGQTNRSGGEEE